MVLILMSGIGWIVISSVPDSTSTDSLIAAPQHGFRAPDITLQAIDGQTVSLTDLQGQVVLVNFWASWCPPCRAEMPDMQKVFEDYQDQGFIILAINSTIQDQQSEAIDFVQAYGLTFPILFDFSGKVTTSYKVEALPTSFFIDRDGIIQEVVIGGPMAEALLRERIEKLLGGG